MGVQEETLERVIKRWKQFLKDLTDEQRAIVELHNPGAVGRLQNRLHNLQRQVTVLGAHSETASWTQRMNPRSELSALWRRLEADVMVADNDLKKTTKMLKIDVVSMILEADGAATEIDQATRTTAVEIVELTSLPEEQGAAEGEADSDPLPNVTTGMTSTQLVPANMRPPLSRDLVYAFNDVFTTTAALLRPFITRSRNARDAPTVFDMV